MDKFFGNIRFTMLSLLLICSFVFVTGCKSDTDILEDKLDQVGLTLKEFTTFFEKNSNNRILWPKEDFQVTVEAKHPERLPEKVAYVWTVVQTAGGNTFEQVMLDRSSESDNRDLIKVCKCPIHLPTEGSYTIRCDLYDKEEYENLKEFAPRLGTIDIPVECQALQFEVQSEIIGEGMYRFVPHIINPEVAPVSYNFQFDFGDNSTKGYYSPDEDITHEYQQEGTFNVDADIWVISNRSIDPRSEGFNIPTPKYSFSVSVGGSEFWIVTLSSPIHAGQDSTFKVMTSGLLPEAPSYEWDFGDSPKYIIPYSNEATHVFQNPGNHVVYVEVYGSTDQESAPLIGTATTTVTVEEKGEPINTLSLLQQTTYLLVTVRGDTTYYISDGRTGPRPGQALTFWSNQPSTTWDGTHFSHKYYDPPTATSGGITVTIEGDVSEEADEILNLTATVIYDDSHTNPGEQREARISSRNIKLEPEAPIPSTNDPSYEPHFVVYIEGPEVANYVTSTFYEHKAPTTSDPDFKTWYDPLEFVDTERTPHLRIEFGMSDDLY